MALSFWLTSKLLFFAATLFFFAQRASSRKTDEVYLSCRWVKTLSSRLLICSPPKHNPATKKWCFPTVSRLGLYVTRTDEKPSPFVKKQLQINEFDQKHVHHTTPPINLLGLQAGSCPTAPCIFHLNYPCFSLAPDSPPEFIGE